MKIDWFDLIRETLKGKTLDRALMNQSLRRFKLSGRLLDAGSCNKGLPSYWRYFQADGVKSRTSVDVVVDNHPDVVGDLCGHLPLPDNHFAVSLCFNTLEHLADPVAAVRELFRLTESGGQLYGSVPFLVGIHADPDDYQRFAPNGLRRLLETSGFIVEEIYKIGGGPFWAGYAPIEMFLPRIIRLLLVPSVLLLDVLFTCVKRGFDQRYPIDLVFVCRKP